MNSNLIQIQQTARILVEAKALDFILKPDKNKKEKEIFKVVFLGF